MDTFDKLVEKHFPKSPLQMLMEMVEDQLDGFEPKKIILEQDGERFSFSIPIPKLIPSEAWGDPSSQSRKDIERVFASITRQPDIRARIEHVNSFLDPAQAVRKAPGGRVNAVLNMLQIIEALQATLNDYNESSAGFVFEGFMAALTGGKQIAGRVGGTLPIEDFVAFSETGDTELPTSLKLLSPKTNIHGSFTNLVDYLFIRGGSGVPAIKYLIAYKKVEGDNVSKLGIYDFVLDRNNFIDAFVRSGAKQNLALLGNQANALKQHIANWQDSPEWRLQMAEILKETPGYTVGRGMFYANLGSGGQFVNRQASDDSTRGVDDFLGTEKRGARSNLYRAAEVAGQEAQREEGPDFEGWLQTLEDETLDAAGLLAKTKKTQLKYNETIKAYFDRGFEHAKSTMNESYFGPFHEREKQLMKEELLLEKADKGGSQWGFSGEMIVNLQSILGTEYYGVVDLSQGNIDELSKIYIEKIGEDLMKLLETTKNFSENIGRYFSTDDRSEAVAANQQAIAQGGEIIASLEDDPAGAGEDEEL